MSLMVENFGDFKNWLEKQDFFIFSGCVEEKYPGIKEGLLTIGNVLNHKFHQYSDQSCCSGPLIKMGLSNQKGLSEFTQLNLNLRKNNERIMLTSCNGCYSYMIQSKKFNTDIKSSMNSNIYNNNNNSNSSNTNNKFPLLLHSVEYLATWVDKIQKLTKFPLIDINFAIHYGCHYLNQYKLSNEDSFRKIYAEYKKMKGWTYNSIPTYLKDIITPLGGNIINYNELLLCCGGSTPQRQINIENSLLVANKKMESIHSAKPDAILVNCPLCQYFFEDSQLMPSLEKKFNKKIPVIHINELLGLMLGNEDLIPLLNESHKISLKPLLDKILEN